MKGLFVLFLISNPPFHNPHKNIIFALSKKDN
jgi:hypothetical protein